MCCPAISSPGADAAREGAEEEKPFEEEPAPEAEVQPEESKERSAEG